MKQTVKISAGGMVMSTLVLVFLAVMLLYWIRRGEAACWITLACVLGGWCVVTLFYAPMAISVDDRNLSIHRSLRIKDIPLSEIASVMPCPPTMAERRLCCSGGFMGYWGWFSERDLGRYFAYYGRSSDCFLVTLKNGRKYMLGCQNSRAMVDAIIARAGIVSR